MVVTERGRELTLLGVLRRDLGPDGLAALRLVDDVVRFSDRVRVGVVDPFASGPGIPKTP